MIKALALTLALFCSVPPCFADGAIARDPRDNSSVVVANKATRDAAIHDAMLACGDGCVIVATYKNACASYAADHREGSLAYGYGLASDPQRADEMALDHCQERGGSCTVMASGCDGQ